MEGASLCRYSHQTDSTAAPADRIRAKDRPTSCPRCSYQQDRHDPTGSRAVVHACPPHARSPLKSRHPLLVPVRLVCLNGCPPTLLSVPCICCPSASAQAGVIC